MEYFKDRIGLYCLFLYFVSLTIADLNLKFASFSIDLRVIALSMAGFFHLLQHKESVVVDAKLLKTIYLFVLLTGISIFFSVNLKASLVSASYIIQWLVVFMVINESIRKKADFYFIYNFFILLILILSIRLLVTTFVDLDNGITSISNHWIDHVSIPILLVPNDIVMVSVFIPFILCHIIISNSKKAKSFWFFILLLNFLPGLVYLSRTAVIAATLSFIFFISYVFSFRKSLTYLLITFLVIVIIDGANSFRMLDKFNGFLYPRLSLWWISLNMFSESMFFGKGPHTFEFFANESYAVSTAMPEFLSTSFLSIKSLNGVSWTHNIYLELLSERGLFSLCVFLLILVISLKKLYIFANQTLSREGRIVAISLSSSVIVFIFAGLVDLTFTHFWVGLIIFSLLALILKIDCFNSE